MLNLQEIRRRLQDRNIAEIARQTGLTRNTIMGIRDGRVTPFYKTAQMLSEYFEQQEKVS